VDVDVLVIGAGQAGLAAAFHLRRRGFPPGAGFVVLDAAAAPGGAWQHRPPTLTMAAVHGFHEVPDAPLPPFAGQLPAREFLPGYFADGTGAVADPRVQLVGYGPSASTVGANRAGRAAAVAVDRLLARSPLERATA